MEDLNARGGSYQKQPDGSIKLIGRTEEAKPVEKPVAAKAAKPGKES